MFSDKTMKDAKKIQTAFKLMFEAEENPDAVYHTLYFLGMVSDRAKDAVLLYKELKHSGMNEEGACYSVYAFLMGDKNASPSNSNFAPPANNVGDLASLANKTKSDLKRR